MQLLVYEYTYTASGDDDSYASLRGDAEGVDGELVLVDVVLLLEYVVQVPNLHPVSKSISYENFSNRQNIRQLRVVLYRYLSLDLFAELEPTTIR